MNTTTLSININGTCSCLYTEMIDLTSIGRLEVTRATTIEFNNTTQHWEVKDNTGRVPYFAPSRNACLQWEQHNL